MSSEVGQTSEYRLWDSNPSMPSTLEPVPLSLKGVCSNDHVTIKFGSWSDFRIQVMGFEPINAIHHETCTIVKGGFYELGIC